MLKTYVNAELPKHQLKCGKNRYSMVKMRDFHKKRNNAIKTKKTNKKIAQNENKDKHMQT